MSEVAEQIVNIAAYQFVSVDRLPERREALRKLGLELQLKGTILLSPEGINLFLAGSPTAMETFLAHLKSDPLFSEISVKESRSDYQPFEHLAVKLKQEIIAFGVEGIDPREGTAPKISPTELKQWLDEGRPLTLLDTRNEYEIEMGTFTGARHLQIGHFRDFPEAIRTLPEEMKQEPIVLFCTGGIRCEKAGPLMMREGFRQVLQLEGGILKYFEDCGGDHWQGECFVFDQRVSLNPQLEESDNCPLPIVHCPLLVYLASR